MAKKVRVDKEKLQTWISEVEDVEDDADTFVYYDKAKRKAYDDGYMAWNTDYTYPERSNEGWQVACMKDGELFWDKQRSVAMSMCERHICNDHVTKPPIKWEIPDEPPF